MPGGCFFTVEFRHPDDAVLDEPTRRCARNLHGWPTKTGLGAQIEQIFTYAPIPFAPRCIDAVREAAQALGLLHGYRVRRGSCVLCRARRADGDDFVPCVDGLSHNEAEAITPEWAAAGADVLLRAVLRSAQEA